MNGILLLDKEQTWTSNDAVVKLKGILHQRRVGHAGTLDPMATGLLVVFAGRATRAVSFAESARKRYRAALRLGTVTDTQDIWGTVLEQHEAGITREKLETGRATADSAHVLRHPRGGKAPVRHCTKGRRGGTESPAHHGP